MMKSVNVRLDRFGHEALEAHLRGSGASEADTLHVAVRYYLGDAGSGRMAWRVPGDYAQPESNEELELATRRRSARRAAAGVPASAA